MNDLKFALRQLRKAPGFTIAAVIVLALGIGEKSDTRRAFGAIVSSNYFSVFGVPLARGRTFLPEEETPGAGRAVAIVSYSYWQKQNAVPSLIGSQMMINGHPFTIVGIAPKGFTTEMIFSPEVWLPLGVYDQVVNDFQDSEKKTVFGDRAGQQLNMVGRL